MNAKLRRIAALTCVLLAGCAAPNARPPAPQPVTAVDVKQADPWYWLDKPAVTSIPCPDFQRLWSACGDELRGRLFSIDRQDYRGGLLTSEPLISRQFFEIWRSDAVTVGDIATSSLATVRRTVRFEVSRQPDGSYIAKPKVLVERFSSAEHRITVTGEYHTALVGDRVIGTTELDEGQTFPTDYWYPTGRDEALERDLAKSIQHRLTPPN